MRELSGGDGNYVLYFDLCFWCMVYKSGKSH